jgi:glycosyltransferase involved in cell wall biosynthesis
MAGPEQAHAVQSLLGPDVVGIFAHRLGAMCPLVGVQAHSRPPVFFDLDDIEHRKVIRDLARGRFYPGKLASYLRVPALFLGELQAIRRARTTFVCSSGDQRFLARFVGRDRIAIVPNVASFPAFVPPPATEETLLFIGSFTYAPNVDAADHLVREVWPRIRALRPEAKLLIAGQRPERIPSFGDNVPGVVFTGFVDDLAQLYASVRVVCCPIRSGGGTRIKIIEAAGYAKPVVSTVIGAEGLLFADPDEIVVARSDAGFANACAQLLGDPEQAQALGNAARRRALAVYDRNTVIQTIRSIVMRALGALPAAGAR